MEPFFEGGGIGDIYYTVEYKRKWQLLWREIKFDGDPKGCSKKFGSMDDAKRGILVHQYGLTKHIVYEGSF
jgi:hypothetical protein